MPFSVYLLQNLFVCVFLNRSILDDMDLEDFLDFAAKAASTKSAAASTLGNAASSSGVNVSPQTSIPVMKPNSSVQNLGSIRSPATVVFVSSSVVVLSHSANFSLDVIFSFHLSNSNLGGAKSNSSFRFVPSQQQLPSCGRSQLRAHCFYCAVRPRWQFSISHSLFFAVVIFSRPQR